ncbi:hypothetical protein GCM10023321_81160 [Pseudonocardia eucalypti]|uniref:Uncharacterized protein n=1 Tax=Pseudonocardia eucalypti TaxID=648755 RepID=A0ABP9RDV8_9PSEU
MTGFGAAAARAIRSSSHRARSALSSDEGSAIRLCRMNAETAAPRWDWETQELRAAWRPSNTNVPPPASGVSRTSWPSTRPVDMPASSTPGGANRTTCSPEASPRNSIGEESTAAHSSSGVPPSTSNSLGNSTSLRNRTSQSTIWSASGSRSPSAPARRSWSSSRSSASASDPSVSAASRTGSDKPSSHSSARPSAAAALASSSLPIHHCSAGRP